MKNTPRIAFLSLILQLAILRLAQSQVVTHGPVVGGVTNTTAQVLVRSDQAASVSLRWGTDPNLATFQVTGSFTTAFSSDFTKMIPLSGLPAETTIYLNPLVNGVPQVAGPPYPSFATFAAAEVSRSFNFVVLTDFANVAGLTQNIPTFAHAAAEAPAFAFIGGDFDHRNPNGLAIKRNMFHELYDASTPYMGDFVNLILKKYPIVHQWDDHDAGQNNLDRTYLHWDLSQQVFQEWVPSYPLSGVIPGIWQKFRYAQLEGFVLDCRSQRDPENDFDGPDKSMLDGNNLGATGQLQWLKDSLRASTARWKVIFTSVVINPTTKVPDGWGGYQTEWNALRSFINDQNITGVVFISGDLHLDAIDNGGNAGFPEMCVAPPGGIALGSYCSTDAPGNWSEGYYEGLCAGYGVVSVLQNPDRLLLQAVDQFGTRQVTYTVVDGSPTPTPTATPSPTPGFPAIRTQPTDVSVKVGQTARFTVSATGDSPLRYQWRKDGGNISGATRPSYITPATTSSDNGALFSVVVMNPIGSVTSVNATLTVVSSTPPTITSQPMNRAVRVGQTAKFSVVATGTAPLAYQWRKNGVEISGANAATYITPSTTTGDNGALFSVVVTNVAGSAASDNAVLTVR